MHYLMLYLIKPHTLNIRKKIVVGRRFIYFKYMYVNCSNKLILSRFSVVTTAMKNLQEKKDGQGMQVEGMCDVRQ